MAANGDLSFRHRFISLLRTALTLVFWFCISSSIILTTKWLFENYFKFPLTVTAFSNTLTTVWAAIFALNPHWRPEPLTRKEFRNYVLPIGVATALEIGCSNMALKILTVSFGTILKGGAPVFTMMWGLLLDIEKFSLNLCVSLFVIALGIALAAAGEGHKFVLTGFILQLLATVLGGLRWAMTQRFLRGNCEGERSEHMSPLKATLYTSPTTALCVLPFALIFEGTQVVARMTHLEPNEFKIIFGTAFFVGTLVFILLMSEYWLVNATSSLALSVAGVFKELLTIAGGISFFKDSLSLLNTIGFTVCQMGIGAYVWLRYDPGEESEVSQVSPFALPLTQVDTFREDEPEEVNAYSRATDQVPEPVLVTVGR